MKRTPLRRVSQRGRRTKGKRGEKEVAAIWRSWGFERAVPSPGSGGLRPAGAGDLSPWPGDIYGCKPWLIEVKYDERVSRNSRGWRGEAFIRATLRDLSLLWGRHMGIIGAGPVYPVLFARANLMPWEVWVPEFLLCEAVGTSVDHPSAWVNLQPEMFRDLLLLPLDGRGDIDGTLDDHPRSPQPEHAVRNLERGVGIDDAENREYDGPDELPAG